MSGNYGKVFAALQVSRVAVIRLAVLGFALTTRASPEFCVRDNNFRVIREIHKFVFSVHDSVDFATSNCEKTNQKTIKVESLLMLLVMTMKVMIILAMQW